MVFMPGVKKFGSSLRKFTDRPSILKDLRMFLVNFLPSFTEICIKGSSAPFVLTLNRCREETSSNGAVGCDKPQNGDGDYITRIYCK